jgi:cytochrome c oxidase assembly factor CtaG
MSGTAMGQGLARGKAATGLVAAASLLLVASPASAHGGDRLADHAVSAWTFEPVTIALLVVSGLLYGVGVRRLWTHAGARRGLAPWRVVSFAAGLAAIALALLSPLDWLAAQVFSAHMVQHEVLMLVAAPLLVFGQPFVAWLWALPRSWREPAGRSVQRRPFARAWRAITTPAAVFAIQFAALWVWHAPRLYQAAVNDYGVHAAQHLSFLFSAALFWWAMIHGRFGRLRYGASVAFVFLTALHSSALGALLTFAPAVLYPVYDAPAVAWHVDPLADQQLAGLLMWVPSGLLFIGFGLGLFAAWLGESERRAALGSLGPSAGGRSVAGRLESK